MTFTATNKPGFYTRDPHRYRPIALATGVHLTAAEALERLLALAKELEARPRRLCLSAFDDDGEPLGCEVISLHEAKLIIAGRKLAVFTRPPIVLARLTMPA